MPNQYTIIIFLILLISCKDSSCLLETNSVVELGMVKVGDTVSFDLPVYNNSNVKDILIKKISSECSCTMLQDTNILVRQKEHIVLRGKFLAGKLDTGQKTARLVINSTSDSIFNIVEIKTTVYE